ncbi:ABC transporter ATP-binding protein [Demequina sp. NBRC 110054]|uniref:ABC transporter ATP-binding protein n=1 Tax=Demequina sp. NBRC 110054 TaxID=1570343 RepID=UPI0009FD8DC0|nr:ABC transporter ATP-binding protein [Demequina sp. NBRC 110054]
MAQNQFVLEFAGVKKRYADGAPLTVKGLSLRVREGEFFSLIGPSGCGKTTTLKLVSGLEEPTDGDILIDGEHVVGTPPHKRPVHTVFQNYALFPHMTVSENIAFGLKESRIARSEIPGRVAEAIELVGLGGQQAKKPAELSGGMQQRVALARSLVLRPRLLLLDEPLGALDLKLRQHMQVQLKHIQRETGVAFLYVTHDQEEAFTMSDRIGFMHAGELAQVASPSEMYRNPRNSVVADFVGAANSLPVTAVDGTRISTDLFDCAVPSERFADGFSASEPAVLVLRPEHLSLAVGADKPDASVVLRGRVDDVSFKGSHLSVAVKAGDALLTADVHDIRLGETLRPGVEVSLGFDPQDAWVCPYTGVVG